MSATLRVFAERPRRAKGAARRVKRSSALGRASFLLCASASLSPGRNGLLRKPAKQESEMLRAGMQSGVCDESKKTVQEK